MVDTGSHGLGAWGAAKAVNAFEPVLGFAVSGPEMAVLVLGAVLPDVVSEPLVWLARVRHLGKCRRSFWHYDQGMSRDLGKLVRERPAYLWAYKFFHSLPGLALTTLVVGAVFGWDLAVFWGAGHSSQVVIDAYTHRVCWPWWPLNVCASKLASRNWWEYEAYVCFDRVQIPKVYAGIIPLSLVGIADVTYRCL